MSSLDYLNRVYLKIDLDQICENIRKVIEKVGKDTKVMPVVKADAYGHGAIEVSKALSEIGTYGFAVATVGEALALRRAGITKPLLILDFVFPNQFETIIRNDIMLTIFQYSIAEKLDAAAAQMGTTAHIHLKIDTGMGRIGYIPDEKSIEEIKRIAELPNIEIDGIFTHFACADSADKTSMNAQLKLFREFVEKLEMLGINIPIKHVCNSAAIIDMHDDFLNMVRSGIITYGLYPSEEVNKDNLDVRPAMELHSVVINVKTINKGDTVSYGSTYVAEKPTVIATIPVGYADGYPRQLSNKGSVLIHGKRAKIVGRVCMDQFMVDVTDIPDVMIGDNVTLVGKDGDDFISCEEIGEISGRFNYEFLCCITRRVPRVYMRNGKTRKIVDYLE
ncbi:MAG: alanine racemase [Clostridia bacterium]|nr:alanine racemase [Clostridia bacterium]